MVQDGPEIKPHLITEESFQRALDREVEDWASLAPRLAIYIAGPISTEIGDRPINLHHPLVVQRLDHALGVAESLITHGLWPYIPHLTIAWNHYHPHTQGYWMRLDIFWLSRCNALLRLPGASKGADQEVEEAERLTMPIFYNERSLYAWASKMS